jgi:Fe-S oxidoreductase
MRWAPTAATAKWLGGLDASRALPRFASQTFRHWFAGRPGSGGVPVVLWVDTFTDNFSPEVGRAAVKVLEAAGYAVQLVDKRVCCGLTWISTGQLDGARRQLRATLDAVEPILTAGLPIVGLEPSCIAVLRRDITELLPADWRAAKIATSIHTLAELLCGTPDWVPPDLHGIRCVAQPHCHQHAVMGWEAESALLTQAGADVEVLGGCCGLAGNFGFERGHYEISLAVAELELLPAVRKSRAGTVTLADGFSCRTQLEQLGHGAHGVHLAQLLADHLAGAPRPRVSR